MLFCFIKLFFSLPVLAISCDEEKKKVVIIAHVPSSLVEKGLIASEWANTTALVVGGKGGGKVVF